MGGKVDKISLALLSDMENGNIPANTRLPSEHELCARFNVSRNTVRKAIELLAARGNVILNKNRGTFATSKPLGKSSLSTISVMLPGGFEFKKDIQDMIFHKDYASGIFIQDSFKWDASSEEKFLRQVLDQRHLALLAFCTPLSNTNEKTIEELAGAGIRVVHMEYYNTSLPKGSCCVPDYLRAGREAAQHLMQSGYGNLYFCGYQTEAPSEFLLSQGFFETMSEYGRGIAEKMDLLTAVRDSNYFHIKDYGSNPHIEEDPKAFFGKLGQRPGIFCGTKTRAAKLLRILKENNIRVPEDVGVIAAEMLYEYKESDRSMDYVYFDRLDMFKTAIDEVTKFHFKEIRELGIPHIRINGTSRPQ